MSSTPVRTRLLQAFDIIQVLSAKVVLDFHLGQSGRDVEDLLVCQFADFACGVDVKAS